MIKHDVNLYENVGATIRTRKRYVALTWYYYKRNVTHPMCLLIINPIKLHDNIFHKETYMHVRNFYRTINLVSTWREIFWMQKF